MASFGFGFYDCVAANEALRFSCVVSFGATHFFVPENAWQNKNEREVMGMKNEIAKLLKIIAIITLIAGIICTIWGMTDNYYIAILLSALALLSQQRSLEALLR